MSIVALQNETTSLAVSPTEVLGLQEFGKLVVGAGTPERGYLVCRTQSIHYRFAGCRNENGVSVPALTPFFFILAIATMRMGSITRIHIYTGVGLRRPQRNGGNDEVSSPPSNTLHKTYQESQFQSGEGIYLGLRSL